MRSKVLFNLFFLFLFFSTNAQEKLKLYKAVYRYNNIWVPQQFPAFDNCLTQSSEFNIHPNLKFPISILKRDFFNFSSYLKVATGGDLKLEVNIEEGKIVRPEVSAIVDKNSNNNAFTQNIKGYTASCLITIPVSIKFYAIQNGTYKFVTKMEYSELSTIYSQTRNQYREIVNEVFPDENSAKEALAALKKSILEGDGFEENISSTLKKIERNVNEKIGYFKTTNREQLAFFFIKSKNHPEYERMNTLKSMISKSMSEINYERGLDISEYEEQLTYLEKLYFKQSGNSPDEQELKFMCILNLANLYYLAEKKELAVSWAQLGIQNEFKDRFDKSIIDRLADFVPNPVKLRKHTNRFKLLNDKALVLNIQRKKVEEEAVEIYFQKLEQEKIDIEEQGQLKENAVKTHLNKRNEVIGDMNSQDNSEILTMLLKNFGGKENLVKIEKLQLKSSMFLQGMVSPTIEEIDCIDHNSFLSKKRDIYSVITIYNPKEAWYLDKKMVPRKWMQVNNQQFYANMLQLDPIYLLTNIDFGNWANYEIKNDELIEQSLCYHLVLFENEFNSNNRPIPKRQLDFFVDKNSGKLLSNTIITYEEGHKISTEKIKYLDYKELPDLPSSNFSFKSEHSFEDFNGLVNFTKIIDLVNINPVIPARIFIKDVYFGGVK